LIGFRSKLRGQGVHFKDQDLWPLWDKVQLAEFYYPKSLSDGLEKIVAATSK